MLARRLEDRDYLIGDRFSIADLPAGAFAHRWFAMPIERPPQANLLRWYRLLAGRSAYRERVMLPLT